MATSKDFIRSGIIRANHALYHAQRACRDISPLSNSAGYSRFVISSPGRSGSTMLLQRCASHPEVQCYGELMHKDRIYWHRNYMDPDSPGLLWERNRDPWAFLQRHLWRLHWPGRKAVGFKLLHDQLMANRAALKPLIDDVKGVKVIQLHRDNGFDIFLSTMNFDRQDEKGQLYRSTRKQPPPLHVDLEVCQEFLKRLDLLNAITDRIFERHSSLSLTYERLVAEPEGENRKICAFLGVSDVPLSHSLVKLNRGALCDKIQNFDEVQRHFTGTKWERFLDIG